MRNVSRTTSRTPTPQLMPTQGTDRYRTACPPSPTAPEPRKSAMRCCGRRRAESGSASTNAATHVTQRDYESALSPTRASASLRSAARVNPWHGWRRPDCRCRNGFHITTAAYDAFVAENRLDEPDQGAAGRRQRSGDQPTDQAASGIAALFTSHEIPRRDRS